MENNIDQNIQSKVSYKEEVQLPYGESVPSPPMTSFAHWGQKLMAGKATVTNSLPDWFATYAFVSYLIALVGVNVFYSNFATEWYFWLFGIAWVVGFFFISVHFSRLWSVLHVRKSKRFEKKLFWAGFWIRAVYVLFIHFFYLSVTGEAQEFQAADSISYIELVQDWCLYWEQDILWGKLIVEAQHGISDMGFPLFELLPVRWFGVDSAMIFIRLLNALIGSYTAVLIYRIVCRAMGDTTARIAAIFCMLHPVLICYAGILLKEVLMTYLVVLFIDLGDKLLRNKKYSFGTIAPMVLVGGSLFLFRTVLGIIAFMALFFALVMMSSKIVSFGKKIALGLIIAGILLMSVSDTIIREIEQITSTDVRSLQENSMSRRYGTEGGKKTGNAFAKYAGTAVFAPLIFTIPFPTIVNAVEGQEDMRLIHGGNWMRNVMSGFVILAMFMLLLSGDWRKYTLPLAMLLGYLLMLAFTQFAHSLRFHIPVMPFEMMFAAYAITNMRKKHRNWYMIWCLFMVVACFAWNWFKLAGRGLA